RPGATATPPFMSTVPRPHSTSWPSTVRSSVGRLPCTGTVSMCPATTTRRERPRWVRATTASPSRRTSRCGRPASAASTASASCPSAPETEGMSHSARVRSTTSTVCRSGRRGGPAEVGTARSLTGAVEGACGLGDGAGERGVDRVDVGELVGGDALGDGDGEREDELAGARGDHDTADDGTGVPVGDDLDEALPDAEHLRPRVAGERQLGDDGVDHAVEHLSLGDADGG